MWISLGLSFLLVMCSQAPTSKQTGTCRAGKSNWVWFSWKFLIKSSIKELQKPFDLIWSWLHFDSIPKYDSNLYKTESGDIQIFWSLKICKILNTAFQSSWFVPVGQDHVRRWRRRRRRAFAASVVTEEQRRRPSHAARPAAGVSVDAAGHDEPRLEPVHWRRRRSSGLVSCWRVVLLLMLRPGGGRSGDCWRRRQACPRSPGRFLLCVHVLVIRSAEVLWNEERIHSLNSIENGFQRWKLWKIL
jgi:hypothetical protein